LASLRYSGREAADGRYRERTTTKERSKVDNLTGLMQERGSKAADMRAVIERAERGEITPGDGDLQTAKLASEIRELDARIAEAKAYDGTDVSLGQRSQVAASEVTRNGRDTRTLGEAMIGELRSIFTTGAGSALVPTEQLPRVFDRLAETSAGLKSGFTVIPTASSELRIPHLTADVSAAWVAEGDTIAASDPGLEPILATPRKLAALTSLSNEVILDSNPKVLDLTFGNLLRALANGLDLAFFEGSGVAPEIKGLKNVAGIQKIDMGTDGAAFTDLDPFSEAMSLLEQANAEATAIVTNARTWGDLMKLREQTGSLKPLLSESAGSPTGGVRRTLLGVPVYLTPHVSVNETHGAANDASAVYVYQANQVVAVRREEARIELDRSALFASDMSQVRGVIRYDMVVPNPAAVCRIEGVIPAA
jgi:HK97 family phage major capsid protein